MSAWLKENEAAIVGLSTFALVVVTSYYALLTHKILRVTQRSVVGAQLAIVGLQDEGEAGFGPGEKAHCIAMHVTNSGPGPAYEFVPRLSVSPSRLRRGISLDYIDDGPDEICGTAVAFEPTNEPKGRYERGEGLSVTVGSRLEDKFTFRGPPGWSPPHERVRVRASLQWRDATGKNRSRRVIVRPLKGSAIFR